MLKSLKELLHRLPFESFEIVTTSGEKYTVTNPDLIAVGKDVVFLFTRNDRFAFIRNNQITAVQSLPAAA